MSYQHFNVQLQSVGQLTKQHGVKCIVYGEAKVGKTCLIGTAPHPIIISAERGLISLRQNFSHLPGVEISTLAQLTDVHDWALKSAEARQFDTICLDSISEIAEVVLTAEKERSKREATLTRKAVNGFQAYAATNDQILSIFRSFRDFAHKHVYFTAKAEKDKDEQSGMMMYQPTMPGKQLTMQLPYMFDEIFRLIKYTDQSGQPQRALLTQSDQQSIAGDRSGRLSMYEPPDLSYIFSKILA